jgi:hypothetical protein
VKARASDPVSSHLAATAVKPGAAFIESAIVAACDVYGYGPLTAEGIAEVLMRWHPGRWTEGTIRTAVSRCEQSGRIVVCGEGRTSRGMKARLYRATGEEQ